MAAEIGSLAVSLSMDANNFNGTISQVDRNLRAMGGELQAVRAQGTEYGQSVEGLSQKQDILQRSLTASSIKLQEQRQKYDEMVASGNASEAALERQAAAVNRAQAQYNRFQTELDQVSTELNELQDVSRRAGQAVTELGENVSKTGGKMKDLGGTMTASVSVPLLALGTGALAVAAQFDTAQARMQAELGVTAEAAKELEGTARNVWKAGFGESLDEVTSALVRVKQNMKEIDGSEIEGVTKNALALAKSFDSDVNEVTRAANNLMVNFGITSEEAFDQLSNGAQSGLNFSNELFDNVAEYSGLFSTLGFEADEYFSLLSKGAQAGVYNLDYLNDVVKEFGIRIKDGSDGVSDALAVLFAPEGIDDFTYALQQNGKATDEYMQLTQKVSAETADEMIKNLQKGGKSAADTSTVLQMVMGDYHEFTEGIDSGAIRGSEAMDTILKKLQALESPAERAQLGVALFGTKWEDLEEKAMFSLIGMSEGLTDVAGTMGKLTEVQEQTFGQRWDNLTRSAASSLEPAGKIMLDLAEDWLPKIATAVEDVTGWFADLSPKAQGATLAIGGIVAVAGPAVAVLGMFVTGIGGIVTASAPLIAGLAGASSGVGLLGTALAFASGPIGLTVAAVGALGVGVYALSQDLGESSIQVEDWSNRVSESTIKAVEGFTNISNDVGQSLSQLHLTSTTITDEMATEMTSKFDAMYSQIVEGANVKHQEQMDSLSNYFLNSSALTSDEEAKILEKRQQTHDTEIEILAAKNQIVAEIMATATEEKRALTDQEREVINNINQQMKEDAVRVLSENEVEQKVILEKMKADASEISAQQAAEVVKNAVEQKEKVIDEANKQYEESIAHITRMRDETGDITTEQAEKMIAEAKKSRDTTIKYAEEMHTEIVSEAKAQAGEHVKQVDWETGEIKSKWEVMKRDVSSHMKELGGNIKSDWTQAYKDASSWIDKKADKVDKSFQAMGKNVGIKMNETADAISKGWNKAYDYLASIDLLQVGRDIVQGLINGINGKIDDVAKATRDLGQSVIDSVSNVLQRKSPSRVMIAIGKDTGEGLAIGVEEKKDRVANAMADVAKGLIDVTKKYSDEEKKFIEKSNADIGKIEKRLGEDLAKIKRTAATAKRKLTTDENLKMQRLIEDAAKKTQAIEDKVDKSSTDKMKKAQKERYDAIKLYVDDKKSLEQLSISDEAEIWKLATEQFAAGTKERVEAQKNYKKSIDAINKEDLESIKQYITDKKSLEELSLTEEAAIWERTSTLFEEGTKERIEAQKSYQTAVQAINKELTATNKEYSDQITKVNEDLVKSEEALNKAYEDAVDKRATSLVNFKGIFDEFKFEIGATGEELMSNLSSQVLAFEEWQRQIDMLSDKAINKGLLAELKEMGPNALPQLIALNSMTDTQLTEYSNLYSKKSKLAREQAEKELVGMKDDTEKQIKGLRDGANKQLDMLQKEWDAKIKSLTKTTSTELSSLEKVGRDAGQGLLNGLASQEGALQAKAKQIADSIKRTIQSALDIHSPSRVMRGFGVNIGQGLIQGMDDSVNKVAGAAQRLASSVEDGGSFNNLTSSSVNRSRTYHGGETHIHVYGEKPSPSEIARRNAQVQRQQAMEWGMA
ncbi:phage tail tape measure protein [Solibacillus cecembensis]|uniref:phage tail tape measure protein n=1 Tax=Solibacillus cecembensis TaxID=459347 RepID=UPI003D07AAA2